MRLMGRRISREVCCDSCGYDTVFVTLAVRPNHLWLHFAIGRKMNNRTTADNNAASRYFTSIAYSADGTCLLAGGNSKYVCIYEISQQILLKKFQISFNRSLDGILDEVSFLLVAFAHALLRLEMRALMFIQILKSISSTPKTSETAAPLMTSTTLRMKTIM